MNHETKQIGLHRGSPRLYFQSQQLAASGFTKGTRYEIEVSSDLGNVILTVVADGRLVVSGKGTDKVVPVIDINSSETLKPFAGMQAVKVQYGAGEIVISRLASEAAAHSRLDRLVKAVAAATLTVAGLAFGAGILDHSAHAGLAQAGFSAQTVLVNEIDADLLEHAAQANPVITGSTVRLAMPMQEVVQDDILMASLPRADVVLAGIPCSGASRAGKSKHGTEIMEDHPEVGHLAYACLAMLQRLQPGVFVLENVPEYASSASASILRSQLRDSGFTVQEVLLNAMDFGAMENRNRWFLIGTTRGITVDLTELVKTPSTKTVADILDKRTDHTWGEFAYLKTKAVTDKAAGKGFQMQLVDLASTKVPVLRRGYAKGGSTDPLLQHPTDPNLLRLFSGDEHARIKGVPPSLVAGMSNTGKHIALGQGVAPGMVIALLQRIGEGLRSLGEIGASVAGYRLDRTVG